MSNQSWLLKQWEKSGSDLAFDEWRAWREEEMAAQAQADSVQHAAEIAAEVVRRFDQKVPTRYFNAEATDTGVLEWVERLRQAPPWPSLLLLGPTGVGKTHQAFGALRQVRRSTASLGIVFIAAADLYASLRPRHGVDTEEAFEYYARAGLLFIDDLGAAKTSDWVEEINYRLINHRYSHIKPTLITSNVPPKELGVALGERVASRLTEMCGVVVLKGQDRRRPPAA